MGVMVVKADVEAVFWKSHSDARWVVLNCFWGFGGGEGSSSIMGEMPWSSWKFAWVWVLKYIWEGGSLCSLFPLYLQF